MNTSAPAAAPSAAAGTTSSRQRRRAWGFWGLSLLLLILIASSMVLGARQTSIAEIREAWPLAWEMLRTDLDTATAAQRGDDFAMVEVAGIIATMRVPRTILAIVVGLALGLAGALIQGLTRNPLADPGMLGVSSGAALAVAAGIYLFGLTSMYAHLWLAFAGAGIAALLIFVLAAGGIGKGDTLGLILAGAALSAVLSSITAGILYIDPNALDSLRFWQAGSVTGRGFDIIIPALFPIALGAVLAVSLGPVLNILNLGSETAQALGTNILRSNILILVALTLLAGAATAAAGPIGFVGLMVPHIARACTGPDYRWILPYSALAGANLLLLADLIGRIVARPGEIQAGIIVALIGAPAFIWLVRHRNVVAL